MLYVRSGVVPDVTFELVPDHVTRLLEIPLGTLVSAAKNLENMQSYANLARLTDPIYCPFHDCLLELRGGGSGNLYSSLWTKSGRQALNIDRFKSLIQLVQPTIYEPMFDGDTPADRSTDKRLLKDRERGHRFLERSLEDPVAADMIIPLVGGHDQRQRNIYLNDALALLTKHKRNVFGVSFEGVHSYGPSTESMDLDLLRPLIEQTKAQLGDSESILFTMPLIWRPDNVVRGIDMGLDLFSGAYVAYMSDRLLVLTFQLTDKLTSPAVGTDYSVGSKEYANSKQSLLLHCQCYACQNYTQAYVNHLIQTKELLGRTLITIHNLHHYHRFFQEIRASLKNQTWPNYRDMILAQYNKETGESL